MAYARQLVQVLFDAGDVAGALNLMIATRGLVEQAFDAAITEGILLGPAAMNRLAKEIIDIVAGSLEFVVAIDADAHFEIMSKTADKIRELL